MTERSDTAGEEMSGRPSRRVVLALGAAAASTVVTIRPALAQTAGSVLNCEIPVPAPQAGAGKFIAADGSLVPAGTAGAYPPLGRPLKGEEVKAMLYGGRTPPAWMPRPLRPMPTIFAVCRRG
jgi:hypothetical protein